MLLSFGVWFTNLKLRMYKKIKNAFLQVDVRKWKEVLHDNLFVFLILVVGCIKNCNILCEKNV